MKSWWSSISLKVKVILGAILSLIGAFLYQKRRADKAETEATIANTKAKDAPLEEHGKMLEEEAAKERAKLDQLNKEKEALKVKDMTPEEVAEYWKNKQ